MSVIDEGIWILPLRGRVVGTRRLLQSLEEFDRGTRVVGILDLDDPDKAELESLLSESPVRVLTFAVAGMMTAQKINYAVSLYPDESFYGLLANDVELTGPETLGRLAGACPLLGLSYCDDGIQGKAMATHPCVDGELVRALGWWAYPKALHNGIDRYLMEMATLGGGCVYLEGLRFRHWHHTAGGAFDEVAARSTCEDTVAGDRLAAYEWRHKDLARSANCIWDAGIMLGVRV